MRLTTVGRKDTQHRSAVFVSIVLVAVGGLSGILFQKYYSVGRLLQGLDKRVKKPCLVRECPCTAPRFLSTAYTPNV